MESVLFLVLRVTVQDLAYYAVKRESGRTWCYDVNKGQLTVYATLKDAPAPSSGTWVRDEIKPRDIPAHVRAGFGAILKESVREAVEVAGLMGIDITEGIQNFASGTTGSVVQARDVQGGISF